MQTVNENGAPAVTAAGAGATQTASGQRGAALTTLSARLIGPRQAGVCIGVATCAGGLARTELTSACDDVLKEGAALGSAAETSNIIDLITLCFECGDVRAGRGERTLFVWMFVHLYSLFPTIMVTLLRSVPHFASWKALQRIHTEATEQYKAAAHDDESPCPADAARKGLWHACTGAIARLWASQLVQDGTILEAQEAAAKAMVVLDVSAAADDKSDDTSDATNKEQKPSISLAAKWAPRIHSSVDYASGLGRVLAFEVANLVGRKSFSPYTLPSLVEDEMFYRKLVARLSAAVDVVEQKMSAKRWASIVPHCVPSKANNKYKAAFLNQIPTKRQRRDDETRDYGVRGGVKYSSHGTIMTRSLEKDRIACATNFVKAIRDTIAGTTTRRIKGGNAPHELVEHFMKGRGGISETQDMMVEAMWSTLVSDFRAKGAFEPGVAIVDVSGSMSGRPMCAAIALGLLTMRLQPEGSLFASRIMTFSRTPTWVEVPSDASLGAAVLRVCGADAGTNTNFAAALNLLLEDLVANKVPQEHAPRNLWVFSDMSFDDACGTTEAYGWNTTKEKTTPFHLFEHAGNDIRDSFEAAGYTPPTIMMWNLRADGPPTFASETSTPGVAMLSGFSAAIFEQFGEKEVDIAIATAAMPTPWDTLRAKLESERYIALRATIASGIQELTDVSKTM